jgi:hypothetical protein
LLLHGDGTNGGQNNTFVDGSTNNFTITRNGNTTQGTFSPYGDNWSNYFDGTGDYLTTPDNAAFDFGTGDFTIEFWVYVSGNSTADAGGTRTAAILGCFPTTGTISNSYGFFITGSTTTTGTGVFFQSYQSGTAYTISATTTVAQSTWHHIAVARSSTTTKLFLNGSEIASGTLGNQTVNSAYTITIGRIAYTGYLNELNGYISNLRVLKGTAQYTGSYTVPTAPLTAITNTSLLTCQSNRFRDASTNNFTITRNGDVSVQRFSPFSPTSAYAAGTIGGSGYFDGTGDFLRASASSLSSSSFTIECWILYTGATNVQRTIYDFAAAANGYGMFAYHSTGGNIVVEFFSSNATPNFGSISSSFSGKYNQWVHFAVSYDGSTYRMFFDGVSVGTPLSSATTVVALNSLTVGARSDTTATQVWAGYISNFRYVTGAALYTSTFTPSTSPLGIAGSGTTQLLLNFQNAAIFDNAMMAVPETVGNAQIDTTIKKYGTGSMKFDGTGDYLTIRNNPAFSFGTGDFTIECWVYIAANSSPDGGGNRTAGLFSAYAASGVVSRGYTFEIEGNASTTGTGLSFYNNNSGTQISLIATTTISQGTWHHVAVCRSGTTTRLFLNGSSVASGTLSNQNVNSDYPITIGRLGYASYLQEFNGYIDDLRVTKGVARYTATFTPPTAAFPDL